MDDPSPARVRECRGIPPPRAFSSYETTDPQYLLRHWDRSRGAWRSKACPLYLKGEKGGETTAAVCGGCRNEGERLRDEHPALFATAGASPPPPSRHRRSRPSSAAAPTTARGRLRRLIVPILAVVAGFLHYDHLAALHENAINFSHLSTLERELNFRTEMGFYYSFFKQGVEAPTFLGGFRALLSDDLTEYPTTINALNRFNLYPEVVLSAAYRVYARIMELRGKPTKTCYTINRGDGAPTPQVPSCEGLGEPPYFYVTGVFCLAGFVMMTGYFLLAYAASGGDLSAAILAVAAYFFNHDECTRVMWTPPLRESFSCPFFVWQQLALLRAIREPGSFRRLILLGAATLLFLLPWQFAQFVLALEACALYGCYLFGSLDAPALRRLLMTMLAAGALAFALQWGNALLLTGLFPSVVLAMLMLSLARTDRRLDLGGVAGRSLRIVLEGVVLLALIVGVKYALARLSGVRDDSHVFDMLLAKFHPHYHTFDTKLYLCAPEFDFYTKASILKVSETLALPAAAVSSIAFIIRSLGGSGSGQATPAISARASSERAELTFLFLLAAALAVLAGLIARLKVLFTPQLILTASLLLHGAVCPTPLLRHRRIFAAALLAGMAVRGVPNLRRERAVTGEYSNYRLEEVVRWIRDNTAPTDSFVGPMTVMATVRETTFRPVYNHPHYEDAGLRNRTRHAYSLYSRKPVEDIWRIHGEIVGARYVLAERALCLSQRRGEGCAYRDVWDVEDPVNAGNTPACEKLFDGPGGLEPYFRKVYENSEFAILRVGGDDAVRSALPTTTRLLDRPNARTISSAVGDEADDACSSEPLAEANANDGSSAAELEPTSGAVGRRKYLLYKVQSGEGFNLQRNVFARVARTMAHLPDAHNFTLVLPPFANSIHWSDRSTHPFGTFFDLDVLGEFLDAVELSDFLAKDRRVDTVVHLSVKSNHSDSEAITRRDECTPASITSENSNGWRTELKVRQLGPESAAPFEGSMLGHTFPVRNLVCLEVRYNMHTSHLADVLSDIFASSTTSVLVDNAARISWDHASGEGEGSPDYYDLLAAMRFHRRIHDVARGFMSSRRFGPDFIAVHLRRNDFVKARPNVPAPGEVGVQLAAVVRSMALDERPASQSKSERVVSVYVATDSKEPAKDLADLRAALERSLEREQDLNVTIEVLSFSNTNHGLEEGVVALVDQIICATSAQFVGSNTSYFTKTVFEERLLLGKSIPSTYAVLCSAGSNGNARCRAGDLRECITCTNSWIPILSDEMVGALASTANQQKGLLDRYHGNAPASGQRSDADDGSKIEREDFAEDASSGVCFVVMSQLGSRREEISGEELCSRIRTADRRAACFLLHGQVPVEEQSRGHWTFLPLLISFSSGEYGCNHNTSSSNAQPETSWYVFLKPGAQPNVDAIAEALAPLNSSQPHFMGRALRDSVASICHHFDRDFSFGYPSLDFGFAVNTALIRRINEAQPTGERRFHIDPAYELAKHILEGGIALEDVALPITLPALNGPWNGHPSPQSILVGIKTTKLNHLTRVPIVKKAWADAAARNGAGIIFYSETRDDSIPTEYDGIVNSDEIRGEAKKLRTILEQAAIVFSRGLDGTLEPHAPFEWFVIADDDTLLDFTELRRVLSNYDGLKPVLIGDRYAYGHGMPGGYDYLTGGAGVVLSRRAVEMIVESNRDECVVRETGAVPDDMWLGRCALNLGIPLVDESGFHQARPSDYHSEMISLHRPVSFHRFNDMDEALEISRVYLDYNPYS